MFGRKIAFGAADLDVEEVAKFCRRVGCLVEEGETLAFTK